MCTRGDLIISLSLSVSNDFKYISIYRYPTNMTIHRIGSWLTLNGWALIVRVFLWTSYSSLLFGRLIWNVRNHCLFEHNSNSSCPDSSHTVKTIMSKSSAWFNFLVQPWNPKPQSDILVEWVTPSHMQLCEIEHGWHLQLDDRDCLYRKNITRIVVANGLADSIGTCLLIPVLWRAEAWAS